VSRLVAADPAIAEFVAERGITEVLHFTTNRGLVGIMATGALRCRELLDADEYIERIYTPNCLTRLKDGAWIGYVNMSISRINGRMLGISSGKWHADEDLWWPVLSFEASVLADPGVYFTTTNNTYSSCVKRAEGVEGLRAMFEDGIEWGYYGSRVWRYSSTLDSWPTDPQAEILYPQSLSLDRLQAIYVPRVEYVAEVQSLFGVFPDYQVPVLHEPGVFR
jgi:hypothetical protein